MRILNVFMVFSAFLIIVGCGSSNRGVDLTGTGTGNYYYPQDSTYYGDQYTSDQYYNQYGGYGDDLPSGTFPAIFGHDGQDWTIFLGLIIDPNNSYSVCNTYTYGNPSNQYSIFNSGTFGNPYATYSSMNPQAQVPPTIWSYDTNTGYANFTGYVRVGGGNGITDPRSLCSGTSGGYRPF